MPFKGYSDLWHDVESMINPGYDNLIMKEDNDAVVFENEFCGDYEERLRIDQSTIQKVLYSEATVQTENAEINPVLAIFDKLVADASAIVSLQYTLETFSKKDASNIPIVGLFNSYEEVRSFAFRTKRRNERVQVDLQLKKFQLRFYDEKNIRSDEYCLEIYVNKKLTNPGKLQQEFSVFLASGKHLIEFIFDTIWPHIDANVKKNNQKAQERNEKLHRNNRETVRRSNHPLYFLRDLKSGPSTV